MGVPQGGRMLLVASAGGHVTELKLLAKQFGARQETWMTPRTDQTESELAGKTVVFTHYVGPRSFWQTIRVFPYAWRISWTNVDAVVSTGASIAIPVFLTALVKKKQCFYIESVARFSGKSVTGRILQLLPWVQLYTQHEESADSRWHYGPTVKDSLSAPAAVTRPQVIDLRERPLSILVSLGTVQNRQFNSLIESVIEATSDLQVNIVWQLGSDVDFPIPGEVHKVLPKQDLIEIARKSDLVISQAGVGNVLEFLNLGCKLIVVPRRAARGEHVDDHQVQLSTYLRSESLCVTVEAEDLDQGHLLMAIGRQAYD